MDCHRLVRSSLSCRQPGRAFLEAVLLLLIVTHGVSVLGADTAPRIAVLVEEGLEPQIRASLEQYRFDLEREGYRAVEIAVAASATHHDVRKLLQSQQPLEGAVLVGEVPALMFNTPSREGQPYWHDHLCDAYYADLDGVWKDRNGNGIYDTREGNIEAEIWISRIKPNNPALNGSRAELIRGYFRRNHAYRTGTLAMPPRRAFVVWTTVDILRSTKWGARPGLLYGNNVDVYGGCSIKGAADKLRQFLSDTAGYEWGIINCATFAPVHHLDPHPPEKRAQVEGKRGHERQEAENAAGYTDHGPEDIAFDWVAAARPKTLFCHMLTSEPGRHDYPNYLCGAYLFGGSALVIIAGTQHSGAVGSPNVYPDLAAGRTFGETWCSGLNYGFAHTGEPYARYYCWEKDEGRGTWIGEESMHTQAVLHGDGTLRLPPFYGAR